MTDYQQPTSTARRSGTNGLAVAGMVCGIVGIFFFNFVLGPLGIIFGAVGLRRAPAKGGRGMAVAGIVCGAVAVVLWVILLVVAANGTRMSWHVGG